MAELQNSLANAFDLTKQVRDSTSSGLRDWNDAWSNFMVNYALSDFEYQNNKEMWNLMNEYNSPAAQMQRFKEAGLNPNLIYSQGTPGNASSPVQYKAPSVSFTPNKNSQEIINQRLQGAMQIFGAVNNLCQNIAGMYGAGLDIQLKKNQLVQSDFNTALLRHNYPYFDSRDGSIVSAFHYGDLGNMLNPMSDSFDPQAYLFMQKQGQLPQFWNNYLTSDIQRDLLRYKADYQDFYNKNLLPKFEMYQQGKIDIQEMENELQRYNLEAMEMIPAPIRGILQPLFQYLGPLFKFVFKSARVQR